MCTGKVKFFINKKGYGFVIDDETDKEYFFHVHDCVSTVKRDDLVSFELENTKRGLNAKKVKLL